MTYYGRMGQPLTDNDGRFQMNEAVLVESADGTSKLGIWQGPDEDGNVGYFNVLVDGNVLTYTAARIHPAP